MSNQLNGTWISRVASPQMLAAVFLWAVTTSVALAGTYFNAMARIAALEESRIESKESMREIQRNADILNTRIQVLAITVERLAVSTEALQEEIRLDRRARNGK